MNSGFNLGSRFPTTYPIPTGSSFIQELLLICDSLNNKGTSKYLMKMSSFMMTSKGGNWQTIQEKTEINFTHSVCSASSPAVVL